MVPVPSLNLVYTEEKDYVTAEQAKADGLKEKKLSGTAFRKVNSAPPAERIGGGRRRSGAERRRSPCRW